MMGAAIQKYQKFLEQTVSKSTGCALTRSKRIERRIDIGVELWMTVKVSQGYRRDAARTNNGYAVQN